MTQKRLFYILISLLVLLGLPLCALWLRFSNNVSVPPQNAPKVETKNIKIGAAVISVEMLTTKPQWIKGLSGRIKLDPNTGVFFVFDTSAYWGIWMKDMNFPIDVLWITNDMKISDIVENMKVESYPKVYKPSIPILYVLEVPAGTVNSDSIKVGQSISMY